MPHDLNATAVVEVGFHLGTVIAWVLLFPALIGFLVIWHVVRPQRAPADRSNRINKIRLLWFALTREAELATVISWLRLDESRIAPLVARNNGFIVVRLDDRPQTVAYYANTQAEAEQIRAREHQADPVDWRIYCRVD